MSNVVQFDIMESLDSKAREYITDVIREALTEDGIDPATIGFHLAAYFTLEGDSNCPHCNEEIDEEYEPCVRCGGGDDEMYFIDCDPICPDCITEKEKREEGYDDE